jgi:pimeloyl-ACP methyl ester carboxylesterase
LDHLNIERTHEVGWSMGSLIAQELALSQTERIHRLVLLATFARPDSTMLLWLTMAQQAEERALDPRGIALWSLPWMFTPAFMTQPELVEAALPQTVSPRTC